MRRVFSILGAAVKLALLVAAAGWVYLHPGVITMEWQGQIIETSVGFAAFILAIVMFVFALLYHGWRSLLSWPRLWRKQRQVKSLEVGYRALNKGLLAVAAADGANAAKQSRKALQLLPDLALTHLLAAQAAQLNGDEVASDTHLARLAQHPDGQLFGLRGQLSRALQRQDRTEALRLARLAHQQQPKQPWIIDTAVQLETRQRNWLQAEKILRQAIALDTTDKPRWQKDLAAVLLGLSDELRDKGDLEAALDCAREALKRVPGWTPAAVRVAELWQKKAYRRRAQKVLIDAWTLSPHPDLVKAWLYVSGTERASDITESVERLVKSNADNVESAMAMAEAYRQARLWGVARQHAMRAIDYRADRASYRLMADIEQADTGDTKRVRAWLEKASEAKAEPQWICRVTSDRYDAWQPLNRQSDFNTITWQQAETAATLIADPQQVLSLA